MRIIVHGYFGYRNVGEEGALRVVLHMIKKTWKNAEIFVLSADPEWTEKMHKVKAISRKPYSLRSLLTFMKSHVLLVADGERTGFLSLLAYGWVPLAKLFRKRVIYLGVGIVPHVRRGIPINPAEYRKKYPRMSMRFRILLRIILNSCDYISVRDPLSAKILLNLGIERARIRLVSDLVMRLKASPKNRLLQIMKREGISPNLRPIIAVSLRNFADEHANRKVVVEIARFLNNLMSTHNVQVVFLPFSRNPFIKFDDDLKIAQLLKRYLNKKGNLKIIKSTLDPSDIKGIIREADLLIGERYHSVVFAFSEKTPTIALSYDVKVDEFCKRYGIRALNVHYFSAEALNRLLSGLSFRFERKY